MRLWPIHSISFHGFTPNIAACVPNACLADAFDLLRLDAIGVEALASAANTAIDEYRLPPSADRREFHRVHSLVSDTREKALALVELAENLKKTFMPRGEAADSDP
jgi:hypothetical protein